MLFVRRPLPRPLARPPAPLLLAALLAGAASPAAAAIAWTPRLSATAAWQDNATAANRAADILSAFSLAAGAAAAHRTALGPNTALLSTARLDAEAFPQFAALDRAAFAFESAWQRKFGLGPQAPVFTLALSGEAAAARESARDGLGAALALSLHRRFGDATLVTLAHEFRRFDARGPVFARTFSATALTLARPLSTRWSAAATARYRNGDVLSYATPPRPELVALARARTPVTTFGRPMVAYALPHARTLSGALALTCALGDFTGLTLAAEYRDTRKSALRYVNRLVSASLARQF